NQSRLDGLQWLRRTNVDVRFDGEILAERNIEKRPGRFIHAVVFRILDDADDLHPIAFHLQTLADGILSAPTPGDHSLVYDGDARRVFVVRPSEFAPGDQRNAQGGEVVGTDFVVIGGERFVGLRFVAVDANRRRRKRLIAEGNNAGVSSRFDTPQHKNTLDESIL